MPESITRSEKDHHEETIEKIEPTPAAVTSPQPPIIWTPAFILRFVLVLVIGLSMAGLLTEGMVNNYYPGEWSELIFTVITFTAWFAIFASASSVWIRLGSVSGIIWTGFMGLRFCVTLLIPHDQTYT